MIPIHSINANAEPMDICRPLSQIIWPDDEHLINPSWRTDTAVGLAAAIRDTNDLTILPILADALEDAGCENRFVLNHCRFCNKHMRSCWVVSAVLMKPRLLIEKPVQALAALPSPSIPISIPRLTGRITFVQTSVPVDTALASANRNETSNTFETVTLEAIDPAEINVIDRLEVCDYEQNSPLFRTIRTVEYVYYWSLIGAVAVAATVFIVFIIHWALHSLYII